MMLSRDDRNNNELVPGDRDADIFEVVLAGTFDDDIFHSDVRYILVGVFMVKVKGGRISLHFSIMNDHITSFRDQTRSALP